MNENTAKIGLKMGEVEITIEGPSEFVAKQYEEMENKLNLQKKITGETSSKQAKSETKTQKTSKNSKTSKRKKTAPKESSKPANKENGNGMFNKKGLKNKDKLLLAGALAQKNSKENIFGIKDISNIFEQNGLKISNPHSLINYILKNQNVLQQVKKIGRENYYQLTEEGEKYIQSISA